MSMPNMTPEELRDKPTDSEQLKVWAKSIGFELYPSERVIDLMWYIPTANLFVPEKTMALFYRVSQERDQQRLSALDRFEVIDETGRAYVKGSIYGSPVKIELSYQDDGKTLKAFVTAALGPDNSKTKE